MPYDDYAAQRTASLLDRISKDKTIASTNKKAVNDFLNFMRAKGLKPATLHKNIYCLVSYLKILGKKDVLTVTKGDIESALAVLDSSRYASATKRNVKITLKVFYKHFLGEDMYYPKQVAWIKASKANDKKLMPRDILTEDDVLKMLESATNLRDKAIIALLFDFGIRAGELLNMTIADVDLTSNPAHIAVNGKTGIRQIPIMFSVPYMAQYLNLIKKKAPSEYLWATIGTWTNKSNKIDHAGLSKMIKEMAAKAGIQKRVYPHLFRHSRASYYANKLTEQQLKAFFGWTGGSQMAATYVHLSGRDIDNAVLQANGVKVDNSMMEPKLKVKVCRRCQFSNPIESKYCNRCGAPLDETLIMEVRDKESNIKQAIAEALKDPKAIEEIVHTYLMMQANKGKK
ncbi:MAG: site-specific integrase [Candidatus Marsarchaeota archaeon]|nr:site-specific integrase [Candidatus Marsarchaeota archaeon]